nr:phage tail tape measure protein [Clostridium botulinum]
MVAGGFLGKAVKTATDFQAQMSKVQAISGASASQMTTLTSKAREWGAKTKFSASECGQAFEYMGMAGWKTQQMTEGLPGILNLASASGEELGKTSDIVTDSLTAFNLKAKDSSHFADLLASASTNSNTNVSMLGESFKYCAPICGALGMNAKDCTFALGLMANAGIKGSTSGTTLRSALTNLSNPTGNMAKKMQKLGISMTDAKGKVKPLKTILDELRSKFGKLTKAQQAEYASTIFGKTAMSGMLSIINASKEDYDKLYGSLTNCDGVASKMSNTMQNNLQGALTNLKSAFEEMCIGLSVTLIPFLTKVVKKINGLITKFNALPQPVKNTVTKILASILLLSPALMIFGKMVSAIGSVVKAFRMFGGAIKGVVSAFKFLRTGLSIVRTLPALLSPPILITVAIIGVLAFAVYEVIKHWGKIVPFFKNLGKTVTNICHGISNYFKTSIAGWRIMLGGLPSFMNKIGGWMCDGLLGGLGSGLKKVTSFVTNMASSIKNKFKSILGIHSPSRVFRAYGGFIGEGLCLGMDDMKDTINSKVSGMANMITSLGKVKPDFAQLRNDFTSMGNIEANNRIRSSLSGSSVHQQINISPEIKMYINSGELTNQENANKVSKNLQLAIKKMIEDYTTKQYLGDAFTANGF